MPSDIDALRTANQFIKQHGDDAEIECALRCDALLAEGSWEGYIVMMRVYRGIIELRRAKPQSVERVH